MAEPAPAERLPPARAAAPTSPPPAPAPPPRPRRWYGWQALVVHGISDTILTASIAVAGASEDAAGALLVTAGRGRPRGGVVGEAGPGRGYPPPNPSSPRRAASCSLLWVEVAGSQSPRPSAWERIAWPCSGTRPAA